MKVNGSIARKLLPNKAVAPVLRAFLAIENVATTLIVAGSAA